MPAQARRSPFATTSTCGSGARARRGFCRVGPERALPRRVGGRRDGQGEVVGIEDVAESPGLTGVGEVGDPLAGGVSAGVGVVDAPGEGLPGTPLGEGVGDPVAPGAPVGDGTREDSGGTVGSGTPTASRTTRTTSARPVAATVAPAASRIDATTRSAIA